MANFKVVVTKIDGTQEVKTLQAPTITDAERTVKNSFVEVNSYVIEPIPVMSEHAFGKLQDATVMLFGLLFVLIVAEYKVRKWLQE